MTGRNGYAIYWTSYNYPSGINSSGESVTFSYGPFRQRWMAQYSGPSGTETTYTAGKLFEEVVGGGATDYRNYIFAGNELVAVDNRSSTGTNTLTYVLSDHQESIAHLVTSAGTNDVTESFTAYGNRRSGSTWSGPPSSSDETAINAVSRWGYTGATMLGVSMGLNDLNGRVEDAIIGRFLSADPYIPDPENTQSFNRYSYVNNNPLTYIDPSGFDGQNPGGGDNHGGNGPCSAVAQDGCQGPTGQEWGCSVDGVCPTQTVSWSRPPSGVSSTLITFTSAGSGSGGGVDGGGGGSQAKSPAPQGNACSASLGKRVGTALQGAANVALGGAKAVGLAILGSAGVLGAPETGGVSLVGTGAAVYELTSSTGQVAGGLGQLYTAFTGDQSTGGVIQRVGDIVGGPVLGIGTLAVTGTPSAAQTAANAESIFTAGSGLINSQTATEVAQSVADLVLAELGFAGEQSCHTQ